MAAIGEQAESHESSEVLIRRLGLFDATTLGLGSIVGTGVFVSIGIAAGIAGPSVILAIVLAFGVATCNALSSAQLAAAHPVSGGTYEYGYRLLHPALGFTAGWMFLCAKTASAATAALGFAGYLRQLTGAGDGQANILATTTVAVLTIVVLLGVRTSSGANIAIVIVTLSSLVCFIAAGTPVAIAEGAKNLTPFFSDSPGSLFHATALMFVAYSGYARITTLGEEVHEPRRTIPCAILITLAVSAVLYIAVATIAVASVGPDMLRAAAEGEAAPLEIVASQFPIRGVSTIVAIGAMIAMIGVLLNLLLGLSRVLLAMGRRRDVPGIVATLNERRTTPYVAVLVVGAVVAGLALTGSVKTTWTFSAFTVLVYYAITNLAALRVPETQRIYSRWFARAGLAACLFLAFWVEWQVSAAGLGLIAFGLVWHRVAAIRKTQIN